MHAHSRTSVHDYLQEFICIEAGVRGDNGIPNDEVSPITPNAIANCALAIDTFMMANEHLRHAAAISTVFNMETLLDLMKSCNHQKFFNATIFRYINRFQEMMFAVERLQNSRFALELINEIIFNLHQMEAFFVQHSKHSIIMEASPYVCSLLLSRTRLEVFRRNFEADSMAKHIRGQSLVKMLKIHMEHGDANLHAKEELLKSLDGISNETARADISNWIRNDYVNPQIIIDALSYGLAGQIFQALPIIELLNPAFAPLPKESRLHWRDLKIKSKCNKEDIGPEIDFPEQLVHRHLFPLLRIGNMFVLAWSCRFFHDMYANFHDSYAECQNHFAPTLLRFDRLVEAAVRATCEGKD